MFDKTQQTNPERIAADIARAGKLSLRNQEPEPREEPEQDDEDMDMVDEMLLDPRRHTFTPGNINKLKCWFCGEEEASHQ